jgi:hypothetical protein
LEEEEEEEEGMNPLFSILINKLFYKVTDIREMF